MSRWSLVTAWWRWSAVTCWSMARAMAFDGGTHLVDGVLIGLGSGVVLINEHGA